MINKHKVMQDWVQSFLDDNYLYFESTESYPNVRMLVPNYGDYTRYTDILGNKYKSYSFVFVGYERIDYGTSDINTEAESNIINLRNIDYKYENIPYGIWFSGQDPEKSTTTTTEPEITTTTTEEKPEYYIIPIILHKDSNNISQSWSLVIASKFSPYPFGINAQTEFNDNKETRLEKYTYAELLERHSKLLNEYSKLINKYSTIEEKINELSNKINAQVGQTSIDNLTKKFNNLEQKIENTINDKIQEIDEKLSILKWKNINNA